MSSDLGLIMHTAETDPNERPLHRPGDGLPERGFANPGRADEAQYRGLPMRRQLSNGEILDNAALDLFQAEMVLVQDAAR